MTPRRIWSIYHGRFPGERAATLFAAKEAESFAMLGAETVLLVPRRLGRSHEDPYAYFGVKKNFRVVFLPTIDFFWVPLLSRAAFSISFIVFGLSVFFYLLFRAKQDDVIYSNESFPLLLSTLFFPNTIIAVHDFPEHKDAYYALIFRRVQKILSTNNWKKEALMKKFHIASEKIVVIPNAVDVSEFTLSISKEEARKKLHLDVSKKYAIYTGHLYAWKGVHTLAEAAQYMPEVEILFVGGREEDIKQFGEKYKDTKNIHLVGRRPHIEIPLWQCAADVLVLPNTAKEEISAHYTSPMKLFEYMASGRPIVASRIPSIVEHLDDDHATLVKPDDAQALAQGICEALKKKKKPFDLSRYTWDDRARRIISL